MSSLIILRGLPGSGKSTLAKLLSENDKWPVYSIDSYFTNPETNNLILKNINQNYNEIFRTSNLILYQRYKKL